MGFIYFYHFCFSPSYPYNETRKLIETISIDSMIVLVDEEKTEKRCNFIDKSAASQSVA